MISESKYRTLLWLIVILFTMNITMLISFIFHNTASRNTEVTLTEVPSDIRADRGARQFRDKLNLDADQLIQFREINREYNRAAGQITRQLDFLRIDMINELGKQNTDMVKIREINHQFGQYHEQLKNLTADYYLKLKVLINEEQQQELYKIFRGMVQADETSTPPGQRRRRGRGFLRNS